MDRTDIFIGYRRDDTGDSVGRIYDKLCERFGKDHIYKDVDKTPIGKDFGQHILGVLPTCRVFLAIIGKQWIDMRAPDGRRRIDDPQDWVRIELETALNTPGLQVVPVLINDAVIPSEKDLPEPLRALSLLNAAKVRRDPDFHVDMERLMTAIGGAKAGPKPPYKLTLPHVLIAGGALAAFVIAANAMQPKAPDFSGGFTVPSIPGPDAAALAVVGDGTWPPGDIAAMARRANDYVHGKWRQDAVLMSLSVEKNQKGGVDGSFTFYSAEQEEQVTLMNGMLTSPYPRQDDPGQAIQGNFLGLEQAIAQAREIGLNGKQIEKAVLEWSRGEPCGTGNFQIDNAILPRCPPGPRFEGLQWEINSAVGDRKYVPATG